MRIIRAIAAGERNPDVLATYRDVRCHSSTRDDPRRRLEILVYDEAAPDQP
jgi:hypothetical protein